MKKLFAIIYLGAQGETRNATTYAKTKEQAQAQANARYTSVVSVGLVVPVQYEESAPLVHVISDIELLVLAESLYAPIHFGRS